jgi:hypothetical protein
MIVPSLDVELDASNVTVSRASDAGSEYVKLAVGSCAAAADTVQLEPGAFSKVPLRASFEVCQYDHQEDTCVDCGIDTGRGFDKSETSIGDCPILIAVKFAMQSVPLSTSATSVPNRH